jgi:hypothetical protein
MTPTQLLPYLLPEVPGVPDALATQSIMRAANDFCRETGVWNEIQDPIPVEDNVNEYDLVAPAGAQVVTVKSIWMANRELVPVTMERLQELIPNWQEAKGSDPAYYNCPQDWSTVRVYPIPFGANGQTITIRALYAPSQFGADLPQFLVDVYLDEVLAGAKARLMQMPGKAWSNPQLAAFNQAFFNEGVTKAKVFIAHDKVAGSVRVRPVRYGYR